MEERREPNPANPECPICGAADWFSDPRVRYVLHHINAKTGLAIMHRPNVPMVTPFDGFICRVCRFLRLQSAGGTLDPREASDYPR